MSNAARAKLSVIIVNFHSGKLILDCLQSMFEYNDANQLEVIVIDNSSSIPDRHLIRESYPKVNWIDMGYNAGFARANNKGMQFAKGDAFLLLNPDTLSLDNSISRCFPRLMESNYLAAGVQLLDVHQEPQISGSYFVKGGLNHLLPIPYWGDVIR